MDSTDTVVESPLDAGHGNTPGTNTLPEQCSPAGHAVLSTGSEDAEGTEEKAKVNLKKVC